MWAQHSAPAHYYMLEHVCFTPFNQSNLLEAAGASALLNLQDVPHFGRFYIPNQVPLLPDTSCTNELRLYENATRRAALIIGQMQIPSPRNETRSRCSGANYQSRPLRSQRETTSGICSARQSRSAALQIRQGLKSEKGGTVQGESEVPNRPKRDAQSAFGSFGVLLIPRQGQQNMDPALPSTAEMEQDPWRGQEAVLVPAPTSDHIYQNY